MAYDCEHGYHAPLVARAPIEHDGCVNIDFECPACGVVEYTQSWTKAAWRDHLAKEAAKAEQAASVPSHGLWRKRL